MFRKISWSVIFYTSFNKVTFLVFFRRLVHLFLSLLYLCRFSLARFCVNLILKLDLPIKAFRRSLVSKPHGPQTQLRVECALCISKLMTRLHFSQFLWNVIFAKFLAQFLPSWGIETVSGIRKKKNTLTPFRKGGDKKPPYQFFSCNFYKRKN